MYKNISALLVSIITLMLVVIVVCWPNAHAAQLDCPDAYPEAHSSFSVPKQFSCFSLHLEGIDIFNRALISANVLLLGIAALSLLYIRRVSSILPFSVSSLFYSNGDSPPLLSRKHYRWFAKHYSLCP